MTALPELFRALGTLCEPPAPGHDAIAAAVALPAAPGADEYTETFLLQLYPFASVYLGPEGMMGGEARDRIAGFWRALNLEVPTEPDHLAALLGLYASLQERVATEPDPARAALLDSARSALLWEHLLSWAPFYLDRVVEIGGPSYGAWAGLASRALLEEAMHDEPPVHLPSHLREAEALGGDDGPGDAFSGARSGMVVCRADLARAARELGLGLRMGERRFVLRSLLEQDPHATCKWLAGEAARQGALHESLEPRLGVVATHWKERARAAEAFFLRSERAAEEVGANAPGG